jgi:hypothetical protein
LSDTQIAGEVFELLTYSPVRGVKFSLFYGIHCRLLYYFENTEYIYRKYCPGAQNE